MAAIKQKAKNNVQAPKAAVVDLSVGAERQRSEQNLRKLNTYLEKLVAEQSEVLVKTKEALRVEIAERQRAEEVFRFETSRLDALAKLNEMSDATMQELTDFALEEGVRLTRSTIGYFALMNEDETVLTMYSWSKAAMKECAIQDKPIVYPVVNTGLWGEAVRQRKPVITNDYTAPNPLKKSYPEGHVKILRHMNVPVFDGNKIVIVAGVGNKAEPYDESDTRELTLLMQGMWHLLQRRSAKEALQRSKDELELRVQERTADLNRSNKELAQFAYIASHDLQEPLRMIASYTQLLSERYANKLDDDAKEFIAYAVDGAHRMQALINDLLGFSRLGTRRKPFAPVDCEKVFAHVVGNLELATKESAAVVTHERLPTIIGDDQQLVQLFQNLIGNAIKFRGADSPRVHVSAVMQGKEWIFRVRDNGIGIDPQYFDQIFVIFQRLHSRTEYPGTGIGLAISKKVVELHGGRIWVESEPGKGSTFCFSIPTE